MNVSFRFSAIIVILSAVLLAVSVCGNDDDDDSVADDDDAASDDDDSVADDDDDDNDDNTTDMVLVPAGTFWMGCEPEDLECLADESPRHEVTLSAYYIDIFEVTNSRYVEFINDHGNNCNGNDCVEKDASALRLSESDGFWTVDPGYEDHPLVEVTWFGANEFCHWAGGRLPTEAEWEKAAKGEAEHDIYPYGDIWVENAANWIDSGDPYDNGTTPAGYFDDSNHQGLYQTIDGRSPFGAHDLAGNVWEWVNDWYDEDYYTISPLTDPTGPDTGTERVLRGGGWQSSDSFLRSSRRLGNFPFQSATTVGFRCAAD